MRHRKSSYIVLNSVQVFVLTSTSTSLSSIAMKLTSSNILAFGFLSFVSSVIATPTVRAAQDVYVPRITSPTGGANWTVGETREVTWDASSHPVNITNKLGRVMLSKSRYITPLILADKFDILLGRVTITVPWVVDGSDYEIVLFGDSGNYSDDIIIHS